MPALRVLRLAETGTVHVIFCLRETAVSRAEELEERRRCWDERKVEEDVVGWNNCG